MPRTFRVHAPISSLVQFLESINEAREGFLEPGKRRGEDDPLWFRGQHQLSWPLTPKIYRREFRGSEGRDIVEIEAEIRNLFESRGIQLVQGRQPADEWDWYFLMQHHGAPTRLLDWTENPLMGLYFAVKGHHCDEDAVVWVVDPFWLNKQNPFLRRSGVEGVLLPSWGEARPYLIGLEDAFAGTPVRKKLPAAIEAPHVDARLHAQASRFVVFGTDRDLREMFNIRPRAFGLGHVPVARGAVKRIEDELAALGVHAASVFPDVAGLGEFVCDQWRWKERSDSKK